MRTPFILFDTKTDTEKFFVPVRTSIKIRSYKNKQGFSQLYLHVFHKRRVRIALDIYVNPDEWDKKRETLKSNVQANDLRMLIDNVKTKINDIKIFYRLSGKILTLEKFITEFQSSYSRNDFIGFFTEILKTRKGTIKKSTYIKEKAVLNKLKEFQNPISFCDIDFLFFSRYRGHMAKKGNAKTTRNANIKIIKKYLRLAIKNGARIPVELDSVPTGSTGGNTTFLNQDEINLCYKYYTSEFISDTKKIILGYFLFSCFTGLRISDTLKIQRKDILKGMYWLEQTKTSKPQSIELNQTAMKIISACPKLFLTKFSEQHIREQIKIIMKHLGITKPVNYHTSRHSFGTNYILMGGEVSRLQHLMGHGEIKTTMLYVHLAEAEKNKNSDLLDKLIRDS